jgi:CRP/FNR family cyclic AMP-dependent transcriptional regulator
MQLMVRRSDDLTARLAIFSVDNIPRRLAKALLYFSERMGHESENGSVQMMALTHEVLGQFVGTSREIVTQWMNQFRREGYLHYSRSGISMRADMIREWLTRRGETIPSGSAEAVLIHRGRAAMAG